MTDQVSTGTEREENPWFWSMQILQGHKTQTADTKEQVTLAYKYFKYSEMWEY